MQYGNKRWKPTCNFTYNLNRKDQMRQINRRYTEFDKNIIYNHNSATYRIINKEKNILYE